MKKIFNPQFSSSITLKEFANMIGIDTTNFDDNMKKKTKSKKIETIVVGTSGFIGYKK
jgi:hypothetical protein